MTSGAEAPLPQIELGHGKAELEIFVEPTCPFSKKAFAKMRQLLASVGEDKLSIRIRFVSQPWHMFSPVVMRSILAAGAAGGVAMALKVMEGIYERREDFEFEHHNSGPNMDRTPNDILRDISKIAGVDLSEAFRLKRVDQAMRWHARYARQNGIHESPTFMINGIVERNMSSGQTVEEWRGLLRAAIG